MEGIKIKSKLVRFLIQKIGVKLDYHKLKKYIDTGFILIEKAIVNLDKLHFIYFDIYDKMIENEIILADITKDKLILHIGCGPIPATSILLTKKTGVIVTGIDKNIHSVEKATLCVKKSGYSNKIQIKHADAKNFPVDNYDIIIISQGVTPIKEIVKHIAKSMKEDALVILRTSTSPNGEISKNDLFIKEILNINKIIAQKKNALLISILLSKSKN